MRKPERDSRELARIAMGSPAACELFPGLKDITDRRSSEGCCDDQEDDRKILRKAALYIESLPGPDKDKLYRALNLR